MIKLNIIIQRNEFDRGRELQILRRIYLSSPTMHGDEQKYIKQAFDTNWVAPLGENVDCFEKETAEYIGSKGAVALSAGTAALHLAVKLV